MGSKVGLLNGLQAIVYGLLGGYFSQRWMPGAILLWVCATAQFMSAAALLAQRTFAEALTRMTALLSLATVSLLLGLHLQVAVHIVRTFTPIGAQTAWGLLATLGAALPWVLFFPLWQWISLRNTKTERRTQTAVLILLVAAPPLWTGFKGAPQARYASLNGADAAAWIWANWHGEETPSPRENTPVSLVLTHLRNGEPQTQKTSRADRLEDALAELTPSSPPLKGDVLLFEALLEEGDLHQPVLTPDAHAIAPGVQSFTTEDGPMSLRHWLFPQRIQQALFAFEIWLPVVQSRTPLTGWTRQEAWIVDERGPRKLHRGWTKPERLHITGLDQAASEAANHLRHHMKPDGKFAYVVAGPSGKPGGGYNFPRHAGATWFMARMGQETRDPSIVAAAGASANFLVNHTTFLNNGQAYVLDPSRKDGKAWVGTTALALLGLLEADIHPELQLAYTRQLAAAVDPQGKVLGDMTVSTESFEAQPAVTYAQGQVLLALGRASEKGVDAADAALERASRFVREDYWPLPAARLAILDEHWMCLAANQLDKMGHSESGRDICEAYLAQQERLNPNSPLAMPAGPAGGIAEAWMAAALMDARDGHFDTHFDEALAYGQLLIAQRYRSTDAALLPDPAALLGGFRDSAWQLDVRVDAVQHIGFALLDLAELLRLQPAGISKEI